MLFDKELSFSWDQDLAQTAAAYNSENVIDLGVAGTVPGIGGTPIHDIGRGAPILVEGRITQTFASGGAATLTVALVASASPNLGTPTTIDTTGSLALGTLVAGYAFRLGGSIPPGLVVLRYLGLIYTIGAATTTAGKVKAGLILDRQTNPFAP